MFYFEEISEVLKVEMMNSGFDSNAEFEKLSKVYEKIDEKYRVNIIEKFGQVMKKFDEIKRIREKNY